MQNALSLNQLVSILSSRVGEPFSVPLQRELKAIIKYKRAAFLKRSLEKHPEHRKFFMQSFVVRLEEVSDYSLICGADGSIIDPEECRFMQTNCDLPTPIRGSMLFDYVGAPTFKDAYGESTPDFSVFAGYNKWTASRPKWFYVNTRIQVFNTTVMKYIGIRAVLEYPEDVNQCNCSDTNPNLCFDDDSPFPAPQDLINDIMRDILNVELRQKFPGADIAGEVIVDDKQEEINQ